MQGDRLAEALNSVLAAGYNREKMQIEVVDDCSTQNDTEAIVEALCPNRISFIDIIADTISDGLRIGTPAIRSLCKQHIGSSRRCWKAMKARVAMVVAIDAAWGGSDELWSRAAIRLVEDGVTVAACINSTLASCMTGCGI